MAEILKIQPYARLLTMLGEQLIKNERIALIELIKNSYDADATKVDVIFQHFGDNWEITSDSRIIIEDTGTGMTEEVIKNHWLNPATPIKKLDKDKGRNRTKVHNRIIQGEKGIGRFAMLKLGRKITVVTRPIGGDQEFHVTYDLSRYSDDFLSDTGDEGLFLDDIDVLFECRNITPQPAHINQDDEMDGHGTRIIIEDIKGVWSENKVKYVYEDISKLSSIFGETVNLDTIKTEDSFTVTILKDDKVIEFGVAYETRLIDLLTDSAVLRIENGIFDSEHEKFTYTENGVMKELAISDPKISGLRLFRDRFEQRIKEGGGTLKPECGPFSFGFYIFDFSSDASPKFKLDRNDKDLLKSHRIYLYRDGIRVYPYGDPDDDWLQIDVLRGTVSAGSYFSNDQVVGYINITNEKNPKLKDKTNREGLIEEGNATHDFIGLIISFLAYLRNNQYAQYRISLEKKKEQKAIQRQEVERYFEELRILSDGLDNPQLKNAVTTTVSAYKRERDFLQRRVDITETLAGVGLTLETTTHDVLAMSKRVTANIDALIKTLARGHAYDMNALVEDLTSIRGSIGFMTDQLRTIQPLFASSRQRKKMIRIKDEVEKISKVYSGILEDKNIKLTTIEVPGSPLAVRTTIAVVLQVLLNLFDNAIYWLEDHTEKEIKIVLDGDHNRFIFADNGPGIREDDMEYIFEAFYSGKGEEGRGLGLYIARQLLEKNDASIDLLIHSPDKVLPGANFVIDFSVKEE
jgi:signal transduction histidine kinase